MLLFSFNHHYSFILFDIDNDITSMKLILHANEKKDIRPHKSSHFHIIHKQIWMAQEATSASNSKSWIFHETIFPVVRDSFCRLHFRRCWKLQKVFYFLDKFDIYDEIFPWQLQITQEKDIDLLLITHQSLCFTFFLSCLRAVDIIYVHFPCQNSFISLFFFAFV